MSSLSELFRVSNKLNYEIEGQISEIYNGKDMKKDVKTSVMPIIKQKISSLNTLMEELQEAFD